MFSALALVFLWAAWLIAAAVVRNEYLFPSFWDACKEMGRLFTDATFWRALGNTVLRTFLAFLFSLLLGVGFALLSNLHSAVRAFFAPIVSVLRTVPTMAIILILLVLTRDPRIPPIIVSFLVLFPSVYAATLAAIDETEAGYGELARAFGVGAGRKLVKMYLPLVSPPVLRQAGGIFSMGLKITISGEVLANTYRSLGGLMQESKMFTQMPTLMALTLFSILAGFLLEGLCLLLYKLVVRWRT